MDKKWLKILPAAAVLAAVGITCYQSEKMPVEVEQVANNNIMYTNELKEMLLWDQTEEKSTDKSASSSKAKTSVKKTSVKKASKIKTGTKKNTVSGASAAGAGGGGGAGTTVTPTTQVPADGYMDGTYTGSGTGFAGTITVSVTVSANRITAINIVDASSETPSYFASAQGVISKILASQSPNVDAVSGATYSSNGIIQAVQNALSQAIPSASQATPTPTPTPTPKPTKKPAPTPKPEEEQIYQDGTYMGTGAGYSGTVTLTAKIKKGVIKKLEVTHTDTPMFFQKAWDVLENEIIQNQSVDGIDTVSGATYSSNGILDAMKDILRQAKKEETVQTPTPTPEPSVTPTPDVPSDEPLPEPSVTPTPDAPSDEPLPEPSVTPTPDVPSDEPLPEPSVTPTPDAPSDEPLPEPTPTPEPLGPYKDGAYTGSSYGFFGQVNVTVTVLNGQIVSIEQTNDDTPEYFEDAWNGIYPKVMANQSADGVDTVSGATYSSQGILGAIKKALAQALI